jgi:hypothetical protein
VSDGDDNATPGDPLVTRAPTKKTLRLRKQHSELVAKVRHKRRAIERLRDEGRQVVADLAERSTSLRAERRGYDQELHEAFEVIEGDPRMARADRQTVRALYQWLQRWGAISKRETPSSQPSSRDSAPEPSREVKALRPTFLRLASAYHPDKADSSAREQHTEIMKDINRAYSGGDASRLLELERTLDEGEAFAAAADEPQLESVVGALRTQLRDLSREMGDLRKHYEGAIALEFRELAKAGHADPIAAMVDELVAAFRDDEIALDDLLAGPDSPDGDDGWLDDVFAGARESLDRRGRSR